MNRIASIKEADFMQTETRSLADELLSAGKLDEARSVINESLNTLSADDVNERLACLNLLCKIERAAKSHYEALRIHLETYPLAELSSYHILKARFHNGLGITYEELSGNRTEYLDRALIAYEAFRYHAEEAGNAEEVGRAVNNIALVLCRLGRAGEAREQLAKARLYFKDPVRLAEIDGTEAQVSLSENKPLEALSCAVEATRAFIMHGEKKLLDDSIATLIKAAADYRVDQD